MLHNIITASAGQMPLRRENDPNNCVYGGNDSIYLNSAVIFLTWKEQSFSTKIMATTVVWLPWNQHLKWFKGTWRWKTFKKILLIKKKKKNNNSLYFFHPWKSIAVTLACLCGVSAPFVFLQRRTRLGSKIGYKRTTIFCNIFAAELKCR